MKQFAITIIMLATILSCSNTKKESADTQSSKNILPYDWSKPKLLKENMLIALKAKQEKADKVIVDFLNEYTKLEDEINEILQNQPNLDTLNTLAYAEENMVAQEALDLEQEVQRNGFKISSSEGMIYITKNSEFIKSQTIDLLDSTSTEFINLYCEGLDVPCCDDAAITIPENTLAQRVFQWGELSKKVDGLMYKKIVNDEYRRNLQLALEGLDNTPMFDWDTQEYNPKMLEQLRYTIEKYPNSRAAHDFTEFLEILISSNYKSTNTVETYLSNKFENE